MRRLVDAADRQEPTEALAATLTRLAEELTKLKEEMGKLAACEKQLLASPDRIPTVVRWQRAAAAQRRRLQRVRRPASAPARSTLVLVSETSLGVKRT
jgi:hypothetical protein